MHYEKLKKPRNDAFQTWSFIKSLLLSSHKLTTIRDKVKHIRIIHTDLKDIAEAFKEYFSSTGYNLASKITQITQTITKIIYHEVSHLVYFAPLAQMNLSNMQAF